MAVHSKDKIYTLNPKNIKLHYRCEEAEFVYVASDLKLELLNAGELYADVCSGKEIYISVSIDDTAIFAGTLQHQDAHYDPETEEYTITAVHISKKWIEEAKTWQVMPGNMKVNKPTSTGYEYRFDSLTGQNLFHLVGFNFSNCNIYLPAHIENSLDEGTDSREYLEFECGDYNLRQHWIDFSKHYNLLMSFWNNYLGECRLEFIQREALSSTIHRGCDSFLTDYKETFSDPQYASIIFPAYTLVVINMNNRDYTFDLNYYCLFDGNKITLYTFHRHPFNLYDYVYMQPEMIDLSEFLEAPENCLDLRAPLEVYRKAFQNRIVPFRSIPQFKNVTDQYLPETHFNYAQRRYGRYIRPYKQVEANYSELIVCNPYEQMAINGNNMIISEIEYDLKNEETKITGKQYL
ncbi:MAG: hypothetical protein KBG83_00185 [Bacteroidetes bacterium]|nr:hypothetical protein [Bacteroidota bacterium]